MALSSLNLFGVVVSIAMGTPNDAAIGAWSSVCGTLGIWLPSNSILTPGAATAIGSSCSGLLNITITGTKEELGSLLALAAGSPPSDTAAKKKWTQIAEKIIDDFNSNIKVNASTFVATPTGGPVTGTALLVPTVPYLGAALATLAPDAAGSIAYTLFGTMVEAQIIALAQAVPTLMTSPGGGGPLVGMGIIQ